MDLHASQKQHEAAHCRGVIYSAAQNRIVQCGSLYCSAVELTTTQLWYCVMECSAVQTCVLLSLMTAAIEQHIG